MRHWEQWIPKIFSKILRDIINENVPELIAELEELILQGRDLGQFVSDFTWYVRNILVVKTTENAGNMIDMSEENLERLKEEAYAITEEQAYAVYKNTVRAVSRHKICHTEKSSCGGCT